MRSSRTELAAGLMLDFAERTAVASARPPRRYLWTDAFAVCNCLELGLATGEPRWMATALGLVDAVHHTLGKQGGRWISGLPDAEGEAHPTTGGLRIGKPRGERAADEPMDDRLEWDRDGQYFHYLTKWMHALDQVARATGDITFNRWARELAITAHRAFVHSPARGGGRRMHWKMSVDLTRPQVASMGQHDPLDGLITCLQLEATAAQFSAAPGLTDVIADFASMVDTDALPTGDPLGIGGMLADAGRVAQLQRHSAPPLEKDFVETLIDAAAIGLRHYEMQPDLHASADRRLAFRELGLAIGLAVRPILGPDREAGLMLAPFAGLRERIESFWLSPEPRRSASWIAHQDINDVMLATSLIPGGFLALRPRTGTSAETPP